MAGFRAMRHPMPGLRRPLLPPAMSPQLRACRRPARPSGTTNGPTAPFAALLAGYARIADLLGITEPKIWSSFSRVIPREGDRHGTNDMTVGSGFLSA